MKVFPTVHEASWRAIFGAAATYFILVLGANLLASTASIAMWLSDVQRWTAYLVEPTLIAAVLILPIFLFVVVRSGVTLASIGWIPAHVAKAALHVVLFWGTMQAVLVVIAIAGNADVAIHPAWHKVGATVIIVGVLSQLLGNALVEETAIRGFMFTQLLLKLQRVRQGASIAIAVFASALFFALSHIPNRVFIQPMPGLLADQAQLVFAGVMFALLLLGTRNLFTTVGIHALANDPAPLVNANDQAVKGTYLSLLLAVILGSLISRKRAGGGRLER